MEFGTYTLLTKLTRVDNCHEWSPTILRMVVHQPKDGHPPTLGWSPTRRKCTTDFKFGTYTLLTKMRLGENCHGWSPTNPRISPTNPRMFTTSPRMVTHQKEMYYKLQIGHLNITYKTTTRLQLPCLVTYYPYDSHQPTLGWSPIRRKCTTDLKFGN